MYGNISVIPSTGLIDMINLNKYCMYSKKSTYILVSAFSMFTLAMEKGEGNDTDTTDDNSGTIRHEVFCFY